MWRWALVGRERTGYSSEADAKAKRRYYSCSTPPVLPPPSMQMPATGLQLQAIVLIGLGRAVELGG